MKKCDGCTLCCKLFYIPYMNSNHGDYCKECIPTVGCKIHTIRPEKCKTFQCAYTQMLHVHSDLRPDKCGVVFEKITSTLMLGTTDGKIENISHLIKNQIAAFGREGISTMMQQFNPHKWRCSMVPGASKEEIIKSLKDKAHDST